MSLASWCKRATTWHKWNEQHECQKMTAFLTFSRAARIVLTLLVAEFALIGLPVAASDLAAQTSRGGGVDIKVTPRSLRRDAKVWEFDVVFDTHSVALAGDPAQFSSLIDSQGRVQPPSAWKGDPPGGHHRKGTLQFKPIAGATEVELRINGVGGVAVRSFRWRL